MLPPSGWFTYPGKKPDSLLSEEEWEVAPESGNKQPWLT